MLPFEVVKNVPGYIKLSDGTELIIRVVIGVIDELEKTPTGLSLGIGFRDVLAAYAPSELKEKVKEKPQPRDREHLTRLDIWEEVEIVEKRNALEEILYTGSDGKKYSVLVEIEPVAVSRTLEFKDERGQPIYHVRWGTRVLQKVIKTL